MSERWDREARRLERQCFDCEADAEKAMAAWQKRSAAHKWWSGSSELVRTERRRPGGGHFG